MGKNNMSPDPVGGRHKYRDKKDEQHSHSVCFFFFQIFISPCAIWGSKSKECKISRFLVNKFFNTCAVFILGRAIAHLARFAICGTKK